MLKLVCISSVCSKLTLLTCGDQLNDVVVHPWVRSRCYLLIGSEHFFSLSAKPIRAGQHHMSGALSGIRPQAHMVSKILPDEGTQKKKSVLSGGATRGK